MPPKTVESAWPQQVPRLPMVPRINLATQAARIIRSYIISERLPVGYRLPSERRLADWLNVSRTVLREALAQLIEEGIVYRPSPRILCVADFDRELVATNLLSANTFTAEQRELVEIRAFIEVGAIGEIVERMTPDHLAQIERWVIDGERRFASRQPTYPADANFHAALLRVLGNESINRLLPMIEETMRLYLVSNPYQLTWEDSETARTIVDEHRQIFEAIKARDAPRATELMRLHHKRNIDVAMKAQARADGLDRKRHAAGDDRKLGE